jgi:S-adenosyl methyltransferase
VHHVIDTLMRPLPAGSFLALSAVTNDNAGDDGSEALARSQAGGMPMKNRSHDEVQDLFRGLELLDPGVVLVHHWRPDEQAAALPDEQVHLYGGVAVKR